MRLSRGEKTHPSWWMARQGRNVREEAQGPLVNIPWMSSPGHTKSQDSVSDLLTTVPLCPVISECSQALFQKRILQGILALLVACPPSALRSCFGYCFGNMWYKCWIQWQWPVLSRYEHCIRNYLVMAWPSLSLPMEAFMEHLPRSSHCDDVKLQPQTRQAHGPSWSRAQAAQRQAAGSQVLKRNSVDRVKEEYRPHRLSSRCSRKPLSHEWTG